MAGLTHAFVSAIGDGGDATLVRPSNWNAAHVGLTVVRKTADETVNNSNSVQNDDHLLFAIAANEEWVASIVLFITTDSNADFRVTVTFPSGATLKQGVGNAYVNNIGSTIAGIWNTASGTIISVGNSTTIMCQLYVWVLNGATPGNVQLQWAQNTATAIDTIVRQGSYLIACNIA